MKPNSKIADTQAFNLERIVIDKPSSDNVIGYYLTSSATISVEDPYQEPDKKLVDSELNRIAKHLINTDNPQLTISIHGYANTKQNSRDRSEKIYKYAASAHPNIDKSKNVFIGYRWPAENIINDDPNLNNLQAFSNKIRFAAEALPTLLLGILISTLGLGIVTVGLLIYQSNKANLIVSFLGLLLLSTAISFGLVKLGDATRVLPIFPNGLFLLLGAVAIGGIATNLIHLPINHNSLLIVLVIFYTLFLGIVLALVALKLVTYPGDRYRATNYAVIDLVEFIRHLERAIIQEVCDRAKLSEEKCSKIRNIEDEPIGERRIRLSFINHSLGCEVVTQTIRILSDVFDPTLRGEGEPSSDIGSVFKLGRIVLVAPDIPLESILSSRSNFLKSALRRCEEAFVFSNEADLALRLASTAANYFSFPSRSRFRGYKLGNVTVKHYANETDLRQEYGILNLSRSGDNRPLQNLEIRASSIERKTINELLNLNEEKAIADLLTYFDCTDYKDVTATPVASEPIVQVHPEEKGILSYALRKSALNLWVDYIVLSIAFLLKIPRHIDGHGGYFEGKFSQRLIYDLAFLGYKEFLNANFSSANNDLSQATEAFSQACRDRGIQVILAPKELPNTPSGESPIQLI